MTQFEFKGNEYLWVQVYELLKQRIAEGVYRPDMPLPSERQLEQELGVAQKTVRKAFHRLRDEKIVYTKPHLGTFVADHSRDVADTPGE
ncbi:winged helix-turn-helix domain-containing protein [Nonomuraea sp. NPDC050394]|uniref:winged helix-turn-helix domain-containing protein n=1 Tax=Nonomuraea sp. NPDC050394 TaxID=3364363 RepID=UPI0037A9121B